MSDDDSFDPFEFDHVIDPFGMTENDFFDASDDVLQYDNMGCRVFVRGGTRVERFLNKNKHTQSKLLNFENWCSGELSKICHHFSNKVV